MAAPLDANALLAQRKSHLRTTRVDLGDLEPSFDMPYLAVYDPNGIPQDEYEENAEKAIASTARNGVQLLFNQIFHLPTTVNLDGVFAQIPQTSPSELNTVVPREKPLPAAKPLTKWEKFAKSKGIAPKKKKDRLVYDEEKQDWVPSWGYKGKNKDAEEQWIHEVKASEDPLHDPHKAAKGERKARKLKNERQQLKNQSRAAAAAVRTTGSASKSGSNKPSGTATPSGLAALESATATSNSTAGPARDSRKAALEAQLQRTRASTASLGRFDKTLSSEDAKLARKAGNTKRKFASNSETGAGEERSQNMKLLKTLGKDDKAAAMRRGDRMSAGQGDSALVNSRKAIRHASKGQGAAALTGEKGGGRKRK